MKGGDSQDADNPPEFPAGLRILVVDDDPLCLKIVERMLTRCSYTVTVCIRAEEALAILRENREKIDIVLSDVYMPDMDGFKLLELIGLELDIPVIMMSANADTQVVLRGITHGAVDYLLKPVRIEELRNIWQHVVRRRHGYEAGQEDIENEKDEDNVAAGEKGEDNTKDEDNAKVPDTSGAKKTANKRKRVGGEGDEKCPKKNEKGEGAESDPEGEEEEDEEEGESTTPKKPRVVWSVELHQQFVNAVNQLGIEKAVPKRILDLMGVSGLTRENVASHLQKYRLYLKRLSGVQQLQSSAHAAAAAAAAAAGYPAAGGSVVTDASIGAPGLVTGVAADMMPPPNAVVGGVQMPYTKPQQNPQFGHFSGPSNQHVMYTPNTYVQQTYSNAYSGMPGNMMPPPNQQQQQPQEQQPQRQRQMGMQQMGSLNDHTGGNSFAPQGFNNDNCRMVYRNVGNPVMVQQSLSQQEAAATAIVTGNLPSMAPSGMQGMNSMQNMSYNSDMEQNRCSTSNVQQGNLGGMYRPQGDILRQIGRGLDDSVTDNLEGKTLELEGGYGKPLQAKQYGEMEQFNNPMVKPASQPQDDILSFFLKGNHFGSEPDLSGIDSLMKIVKK